MNTVYYCKCDSKKCNTVLILDEKPYEGVRGLRIEEPGEAAANIVLPEKLAAAIERAIKAQIKIEAQ